MEGTRINKPGHTIRLFRVAMDSAVPKSSTKMVDEKNVAIHKMAADAVTRWSMDNMIPSQGNNW